MKPASCVLQNPFLKPENLCLAFSRFFGFAGVIRFVAAILGQVVVLVDGCSTFVFLFLLGHGSTGFGMSGLLLQFCNLI